MNGEVTTGFCFGEFEVDPSHRLLLRRGLPVNLNPKTFDLLLTLVENPGRILSKNDLLDKVWENQFVEENNLTVHVAALRKALGETKNEHRFIVTVPGKGYRFVAELNPRTNGDVIIESRKFERIFVEEEIDQREETARRRLSIGLLSPRGARAALAAVLVAFGAGAGFYLLKTPALNNSNAMVAVMPQVKSRIFATSGGIPHRVAISPDGKTLAYVQRYKGQDSIWLGDLETNNSIQLTEASRRLHAYIFYGPDGKSVYFTARDDRNPVWTLMRVSVFGGAVRDLGVRIGSSISFSPDGKELAFLRDNSILAVNAQTGRDERTLLNLEKPRDFTAHGPAWSPDGKLVAVAVSDEAGKGCEIVTVAVTEGTLREIGDNVCRGRTTLTWLNDGKSLVLMSAPPDSSNVQVWLVSAENGERRAITNDTLNYLGYSLSVSRDDRIAVLQARADPKIWISETGDAKRSRQVLEGSRIRAEGTHGNGFVPDGKIVYMARTNDSRAVWEMNADGTEQRQLTPSQKGSHDQQISVTPDNRYLVFESRRSGTVEIWRANRDGGQLLQLTSGGGNESPTITNDGMWVIYASNRDGRTTLWRVPITGGEAAPFTTEPGNFPAVSPDGQWIAYSAGQKISIIAATGGPPIKTLTASTNGVLYNRLRWSPDSRAIIYKDLVQGLWRHDIDKEAPEEIKGFEDLRVFHFAFSNEGKLVYSAGVPMREIVIMENFQ